MLKFLAEWSWANQVGWVLVHSLWQFTLVAILALVLQWTLQRRSAATRYAALLASMMLMVAMPVATWFSPWSIDPPAVGSVLNPVVSRQQQAHGQNGAAAMPSELPAGRAAKPPADDRPSQITPIFLAEMLSRVQRQIQPWLPQIVMVWIAGVLVAAQRPLIGLYMVHRLRTVGVLPVGDAVEAVLRRAARKLRLDRAVKVVQSALVETPVVVGFFRPVVLLPLCVITGLPEPQLESILAHELAHIRRGDYAINLLQTVVETMFFYHPAIWWLSRQIRNERENCCDDIAMAGVGSRVEYGRALLAVEELRATPTGLSLAAGGGSLWARIRRIAEGEPAPRLAGGSSIFCVLIVSTLIFAAVAWAGAPVGDPSITTPTATKSDVATKIDANLESEKDAAEASPNLGGDPDGKPTSLNSALSGNGEPSTERTESAAVPPELLYLAWQKGGTTSTGKATPHKLWDRNGNVLSEKQSAEVLEKVKTFVVHWRRDNELSPLVLVFKVDQRLTSSPILATVLSGDGTRLSEGSARSTPTNGMNVSAVAPNKERLASWPKQISLELKFPIEDPQVLSELTEVPDDPVEVADGVTWYLDPDRALQREGGRLIQAMNKTAAVLQSKQLPDSALSSYGARVFLKDGTELQGCYTTGIKSSGEQYRIDVSDPIQSKGDIIRVRFVRQRFRLEVVKNIPLRLEDLPDSTQ